MAITSRDPLSIAAPFLGESPGDAIDVGMARMKMELAKQAADKDAALKAKELAQKEKEANAKAFEIDYGTVSLPDTLAWAKMMEDEQKIYAQQLMDFKSGKGTDPDNPATDAGRQRLARMGAYKQWVSNSKQKMDYGNNLLGLVRANPFAYRPGAEDAVLGWMSNSEVNDKGEMLPPLQQFFDLDKALDTIGGQLKASGGGKAVTLPDGSIKESQSEYVTDEAVMSAVDKTLLIPGAPEEALRRFQELSAKEPERAKAIMELAKNKGIPAEKAMLWDQLVPVWSFNKYRENLSAPSESGSGRAMEQEGLNWLAEWRKGAEEGKYEGDDTMKLFFGMSPASGASIPDAYKTLKGWTFDEFEVYDKKADKNVKKRTTIEALSLDRDKGEWTIKLDSGERRVMPTDKFESEVIPRLGAYNKDKLQGIGAYLNSARKAGYFDDISGTGAKEMVRTQDKRKAYNSGQAQAKKKAY